MPTRLVFEDTDNNEMDCYLNTKGMVYIGIKQRGEDIISNAFITLDKTDVKQLINILRDCEKEMNVILPNSWTKSSVI